LAAAVRVVYALGPEDLTGLSDDTATVIVDATTGTEPGTVTEIDLADLPAMAADVQARSTHQLPLEQVLGLASVLGWSGRGTFIGIGGASFSAGGVLSEAVEGALPALRAAIVKQVERFAS
jgi:hydrogenase maturation protease